MGRQGQMRPRVARHGQEAVVGVQAWEKGVEGRRQMGLWRQETSWIPRSGDGAVIVWGWSGDTAAASAGAGDALLCCIILQTTLNTVDLFHMLYQAPCRVQ